MAVHICWCPNWLLHDHCKPKLFQYLYENFDSDYYAFCDDLTCYFGFMLLHCAHCLVVILFVYFLKIDVDKITEGVEQEVCVPFIYSRGRFFQSKPPWWYFVTAVQKNIIDIKSFKRSYKCFAGNNWQNWKVSWHDIEQCAWYCHI